MPLLPATRKTPSAIPIDATEKIRPRGYRSASDP